MKALFKKMIETRLGVAILAFVAGGIVTYLFLPEKIKVEIKKETVYVDRIVEKEVIKYVEKEVIKYEKVKVVKRKVTWPDGKIEEEEIYESESEQIDRMAEKYEELMKESEKKWEEKYNYLKEHSNPKWFTVYVGPGFSLEKLQKPFYIGGFNYTVWGPLTIGGQVSTNKDVGLTIGIRF